MASLLNHAAELCFLVQHYRVRLLNEKPMSLKFYILHNSWSHKKSKFNHIWKWYKTSSKIFILNNYQKFPMLHHKMQISIFLMHYLNLCKLKKKKIIIFLNEYPFFFSFFPSFREKQIVIDQVKTAFIEVLEFAMVV